MEHAIIKNMPPLFVPMFLFLYQLFIASMSNWYLSINNEPIDVSGKKLNNAGSK